MNRSHLSGWINFYTEKKNQFFRWVFMDFTLIYLPKIPILFKGFFLELNCPSRDMCMFCKKKFFSTVAGGEGTIFDQYHIVPNNQPGAAGL